MPVRMPYRIFRYFFSSNSMVGLISCESPQPDLMDNPCQNSSDMMVKN